MRILIAITQQSLRQSARLLLASEPDFEVIGESATRTQALKRIESLQPDILVLSLILPNHDLRDFLQRLKAISPQTRVISMQAHPHASGISLAAVADQLIHAVRTAGSNSHTITVPLPDGVRLGLEPPRSVEDPGAFHALTPREREVLIMTAGGLSSAEAAQRLGISPRTVETHRARVMNKLGLHRRADLVRYVIAQGILPTDPEETSGS